MKKLLAAFVIAVAAIPGVAQSLPLDKNPNYIGNMDFMGAYEKSQALSGFYQAADGDQINIHGIVPNAFSASYYAGGKEMGISGFADEKGNPQWMKIYDAVGNSMFVDVHFDQAGNFVIVNKGKGFHKVFKPKKYEYKSYEEQVKVVQELALKNASPETAKKIVQAQADAKAEAQAKAQAQAEAQKANEIAHAQAEAVKAKEFAKQAEANAAKAQKELEDYQKSKAEAEVLAGQEEMQSIKAGGYEIVSAEDEAAEQPAVPAAKPVAEAPVLKWQKQMNEVQAYQQQQISKQQNQKKAGIFGALPAVGQIAAIAR